MLRSYKEFAFCTYKMNTRFYVRSVGDFLLENNEDLMIKRADFPEIFWCVEGVGSFWLDGKRYLLRPGQVWYYPPDSVHRISCYGKVFHYRWITLDGPDARVLFEGLNLKPGINTSGECPHHLFSRVRLNIEVQSLDAQLDNLKTAFEILLKASTPGKSESSDLVHWTDKGLCLKKGDVHGTPTNSAGFWAPEVYYLDGRFYMFYTVEENIGVAVADSPLGPFKKYSDGFLFPGLHIG